MASYEIIGYQDKGLDHKTLNLDSKNNFGGFIVMLVARKENNY